MNRYGTLLVSALVSLALSSCASRRMEGRAAQECVHDLLAKIEPYESLFTLWETGKWKPEEKKDLCIGVANSGNARAPHSIRRVYRGIRAISVRMGETEGETQD